MDKKWMSPTLKTLHRKMQREYFKNRKSAKFKLLKSRFKKLKFKSIRTFYANFVTELKNSDPAKWYTLAKRIGAVDTLRNGDVFVESLENLSGAQAAQQIARHFSEISNDYQPIDFNKLPAFLPAQLPPQVEEYQIYQRLCRLHKTR